MVSKGPPLTVRAPAEFRAQLVAGLGAIRDEFDVPGSFPAAVEAAAEAAAAVPRSGGHVDRTDLPMVTLDPAGSTDLDQAFALERDGEDLVLHYAIADVGWFVEPGGLVEAEAWRRGVTYYLPDGRAPLYPAALGERAASLLPDGPRPVVLLTVRLDPAGTPTLAAASRALIASRAKLAYATVRAAELSPLLGEFARRVTAAEAERGASRVEFPEQEIAGDPERPGGFRLELRERRGTEDQNATLSLAANLAVASTMLEAGTGLFRTMPEPTAQDVRVLRRIAHFLQIDWPKLLPLGELERRLEPGPRTAAFLLAVRRAGGGADYEAWRPGWRPWHSAIAATYAHATAPLRRLADRYVLDAVVALSAGRPVPAYVEQAFAELPDVMDRAETAAARVERAVIDLVEAAMLVGREGESFPATVIDADERGARIQLADPPVVARMAVDGAQPGDHLEVRLVTADPGSRRVEFSPRRAG